MTVWVWSPGPYSGFPAGSAQTLKPVSLLDGVIVPRDWARSVHPRQNAVGDRRSPRSPDSLPIMKSAAPASVVASPNPHSPERPFGRPSHLRNPARHPISVPLMTPVPTRGSARGTAPSLPRRTIWDGTVTCRCHVARTPHAPSVVVRVPDSLRVSLSPTRIAHESREFTPERAYPAKLGAHRSSHRPHHLSAAGSWDLHRLRQSAAE